MTTPDNPVVQFTCSWEEQWKEQRKMGLMIGALTGLKYRVDDDTREVIEKILSEVEDFPTPTR